MQHFERAEYQAGPFRLDDDRSTLQAWLADRRVAGGLNLLPRDYSADEIARYAESFDGRSAILLALRRKAEAPLAALATFELNPRHKAASWTLVIGSREDRDVRAVTAVCVGAIDWLFANTEVQKLTSRVAAHKIVPIHLLDRVGVPREGYLRQETLSADGTRRHDEILHGLLRPEWPAIREQALAQTD